jgi:hypothetical protein
LFFEGFFCFIQNKIKSGEMWSKVVEKTFEVVIGRAYGGISA